MKKIVVTEIDPRKPINERLFDYTFSSSKDAHAFISEKLDHKLIRSYRLGTPNQDGSYSSAFQLYGTVYEDANNDGPNALCAYSSYVREGPVSFSRPIYAIAIDKHTPSYYKEDGSNQLLLHSLIQFITLADAEARHIFKMLEQIS